jgi:hypothetical protein
VRGSKLSLNEQSRRKDAHKEQARPHSKRTKLLSDTVKRGFQRFQSSNRISFKKMKTMKVDEVFEKGIEALEPDEEVVALMPTKEFGIPHGPKRTVLYWLCRDVEMTVKINDYLEGEPQRTGLPLTPTWY